MIDLAARREANKRRLLGLADENSKIPFTKADVENPEVCWEIISLCTRFATVEGANGKKKPSKNLAFPELLEPVEVGNHSTKSKNAKRENITRTNLETMREMYTNRNTMNRHYEDDIDDKYTEYFKSVVEILDGYATQVVTDIIVEDEDFLNRVNKARGCEVAE